MQTIYIVGVLLLVAFLGTRFLFKKENVTSPFAYLFVSGLIYIGLGLFLGDTGLGVLNLGVVRSLFPLVSFGLGWVGFLFGFQMQIRYLRKFARNFRWLSVVHNLIVFVVVSTVLIFLLRLFYPGQSPFLIAGLALAFGLLSTINSPSLIHAVSAHIPQKDRYYYLARFLGSVNGFWGIVGLAVLVSFWHYPFVESRIAVTGVMILIVSIVLSVGLGYVFHVLTRKKISEQDLIVYMLGLVFFISGAAFYFNLSPLFTGMVLGISYSNLTKRHEKLYPLLLRTEKPLYIVLLILIGALWIPYFDWRIALIVGILILLRIISILLPLPFLGKVLGFRFRLPCRLGLCFLSSGSIGIAFAVSIKLAFPIPLTDIFLSVALLSIIISELISPWAAKRTLTLLDKKE